MGDIRLLNNPRYKNVTGLQYCDLKGKNKAPQEGCKSKSEFLYSDKLLIILCFLTRKPPSVYTWYVQYLDYSWILPCECMSMITKTIHISLPESLKEYMDERVNEEHYSTLSDYIRALVREDQKRYAEERLEKLLLEGLESGRGAALGSKEWKQFKKKALSRAKGRKPHA